MHDDDTTSTVNRSQCSSCGVARNTGDRCEYCGALYLDRIETVSPDTKVGSLHNKYQIKQQGNDVLITWSWRRMTTWLMIPFFIFWNSLAFKFVDVSTLLSDPLSQFPIPGIHLLIGILGPVYVLINLINKTSVVANSRYLKIRHHPIPWKGGKQFEAREIKQIFVSKGQRSNKNNSWDVPVLQLVTVHGSRHELLKGWREVEFADYESLRRYLLGALKIDIQPTHGEV